MARTDLWKYCSAEQCREMMLSFRLVGAGDWPPEKIMGCLYASVITRKNITKG